jgi:hypothetical protein
MPKSLRIATTPGAIVINMLKSLAYKARSPIVALLAWYL